MDWPLSSRSLNQSCWISLPITTLLAQACALHQHTYLLCMQVKCPIWAHLLGRQCTTSYAQVDSNNLIPWYNAFILYLSAHILDDNISYSRALILIRQNTVTFWVCFQAILDPPFRKNASLHLSKWEVRVGACWNQMSQRGQWRATYYSTRASFRDLGGAKVSCCLMVRGQSDYIRKVDNKDHFYKLMYVCA